MSILSLNKIPKEIEENPAIRLVFLDHYEDEKITEEIKILNSNVEKEILQLKNELSKISTNLQEENDKRESYKSKIHQIQVENENLKLLKNEKTLLKLEIEELENKIISFNTNKGNIKNNISDDEIMIRSKDIFYTVQNSLTNYMENLKKIKGTGLIISFDEKIKEMKKLELESFEKISSDKRTKNLNEIKEIQNHFETEKLHLEEEILDIKNDIQQEKLKYKEIKQKFPLLFENLYPLNQNNPN